MKQTSVEYIGRSQLIPGVRRTYRAQADVAEWLMNRRRVLLAVACFLAGSILGGAAVFFWTVPPMAEILALVSITASGNEAYVKYRYGSYSVGKAALLKHADALASDSVREGMLGEAGADFDLGLTYGRLAVAAERAGHADEAVRYMHLATQAFQKRGRPHDESQVRASVQRLDAAWDQRLSGVAP